MFCLAGVVAYESLRAFGFKLRWETETTASATDTNPDGPAHDQTRVTASVRRPSSPVGAAAAVDSLPVEVAEANSDDAPSSRGSVLIPPSVSDSVAVGSGDFVSIDFGSFANGQEACTNCPVGDEWASDGVRFSFRSWTSDSPRPFILDARNFLPPGTGLALGPALRGEQGLEVGVLRLDFPGRPKKVAFTLYGPDLITQFDIVVWRGDSILRADAITRSVDRRYRPAGRGEFRAERILVESSLGIDRISLDGWGPPGHVLLIDQLAIDP